MGIGTCCPSYDNYDIFWAGALVYWLREMTHVHEVLGAHLSTGDGMDIFHTNLL